MKILYDGRKKTVETYTFKINGGGIHHVRESVEIGIVFVDKKFSNVEHSLIDTQTRNYWRIMAAINEKIEQIEDADGSEG